MTHGIALLPAVMAVVWSDCVALESVSHDGALQEKDALDFAILISPFA
jgi:hypothetical protein